MGVREDNATRNGSVPRVSAREIAEILHNFVTAVDAEIAAFSSKAERKRVKTKD